MQTLVQSSISKNSQLLDSKTSLRLRAFRNVSRLYAQRERPSVAAEFFLFGVIVLTASYSILTMAQAMGIHR